MSYLFDTYTLIHSKPKLLSPMRISHFFLVSFFLLTACQEESVEQTPEPETPLAGAKLSKAILVPPTFFKPIAPKNLF